MQILIAERVDRAILRILGEQVCHDDGEEEDEVFYEPHANNERTAATEFLALGAPPQVGTATTLAAGITAAIGLQRVICFGSVGLITLSIRSGSRRFSVVSTAHVL